MSVPSERLAYQDKHRAWSELVVAVERSAGRLLVPSECAVERGSSFTLAVAIGDDPPFTVDAVVERVRRSSPRFARALIVRLTPAARSELSSRLGAPDTDGARSFGRHAPRFELAWPVSFRTPALIERVSTHDISADGMHVEMPDRVERGDIVEFTLHTPQGHGLMLAGEVQWTSEVTDRVGIRFLYREDDDRELMRALLLRAVGARLSVFGKPAIVVLFDKGRAASDFDALRAATPLPLEVTSYQPDALRIVREERPRALFVSADEPDVASICRAIVDDAELLGVQVVLYGADPTSLRARAKEAHVVHAVVTPMGVDAARDLVAALALTDDDGEHAEQAHADGRTP